MTDKYEYNQRGHKETRVGQAVYDILSVDQPDYTAEDILDQMQEGILKYLEEAAEKGLKELEGDFYILHLFHKDLSQMGISNVLKQSAAIFPHRNWHPVEVMGAHPNPAKSLYKVDKKNGEMRLLWTVPGYQDCLSILKSPDNYNPMLIKWINCALSAFPKSTHKVA